MTYEKLSALLPGKEIMCKKLEMEPEEKSIKRQKNQNKESIVKYQ